MRPRFGTGCSAGCRRATSRSACRQQNFASAMAACRRNGRADELGIISQNELYQIIYHPLASYKGKHRHT
jgi:hypothetical protein